MVVSTAARVDKSMLDLIGCMLITRGAEACLSLSLATCVLFAGIGCSAHAQMLDEGRPIRLAQQTTTVPPPPSLPSTLPQSQAYFSCVTNCNTNVGMCQGACSANNSPAATFAAPGALTQCYQNCTTRQLACSQACSIH
jgi:hypothetical protein